MGWGLGVPTLDARTLYESWRNLKFVVIGGTGLIGSKVVDWFAQRGEQAKAASPSSGVDPFTGEGLRESLEGSQVAVSALSIPSVFDGSLPRIGVLRLDRRRVTKATPGAVMVDMVDL